MTMNFWPAVTFLVSNSGVLFRHGTKSGFSAFPFHSVSRIQTETGHLVTLQFDP